MKKSILLFSVLFLTFAIGFCQEVKRMTEYPNSELLRQKDKSEKLRTYYFHDTLVDSSLFAQDSILLFKHRINRENSRLELYNDSRFLLVYNIKFKTFIQKRIETGEMSELTIQNSDEIGGMYGLLQVASSENGEIKDESLRFILKDESSFSFKILDMNNQILLLKKQK